MILLRNGPVGTLKLPGSECITFFKDSVVAVVVAVVVVVVVTVAIVVVVALRAHHFAKTNKLHTCTQKQGCSKAGVRQPYNTHIYIYIYIHSRQDVNPAQIPEV